MKLRDFNSRQSAWKSSVMVFFFMAGLGPASIFSQVPASKPASVRGTAKLNGTLVVDGVIVAVRPARKSGSGSGRSTGKPLPSKAVNGDYRIEELRPGEYDLVAVGNEVKGVVQGVILQPGNGNVIDIVLRRANKRSRVRGKVTDSRGSAMANTKVAIYSSELPPSICENCMLAEVTSNDQGEVEYADIAGDETYNLAIRHPSDSKNGETNLMVAEAVTIGTERVTQVELQVGDGPQPALSARVTRTLLFPPEIKKGTFTSPFEDYVAQGTMTIDFRKGSPDLSQQSKAVLDEIAKKALASRGYVLEVSGVTDSMEFLTKSRPLGQRRSDAVIRYLVETHNVPLRKIVTRYAFIDSYPVAEHIGKSEWEPYRSVEVKILVDNRPTPAHPGPRTPLSVPARPKERIP
jgi:outer membrane protein OmpA-like peptidoglycan-associated protein